MTENMNIETLNSASQDEFTAVLAEIYEHSSWIPKQAWQNRPFSDVESLHQDMLNIVLNATKEQKLALLRAHPQLAGKEAKDGVLTNASSEEQSSANLNSLSKEEMDEITSLNKQYMDEHGFPFIIAVKNHDKASIFSEFKRRTANLSEEELLTALRQVGLIATFRLAAIFKEYEAS